MIVTSLGTLSSAARGYCHSWPLMDFTMQWRKMIKETLPMKKWEEKVEEGKEKASVEMWLIAGQWTIFFTVGKDLLEELWVATLFLAECRSSPDRRLLFTRTVVFSFEGVFWMGSLLLPANAILCFLLFSFTCCFKHSLPVVVLPSFVLH